MPADLTTRDWQLLLDRIAEGNCTPVLGAGACTPSLPLGHELATRWAKDYGYPLSDFQELSRVAQYVAIDQRDSRRPKDLIRLDFKARPTPNFDRDDEPHGVLARLPLPIYITTNYDDFMVKALESRGKKPRREVCPWHKPAWDRLPAGLAPPDMPEPTPEAPLVYHLHGILDNVDSMVLTEDDYLDFLTRIAADNTLIPARIERALTETSLLFIGYGLRDWSFRVIHRGLVARKSRFDKLFGVTVQFPPEGSEAERERIQKWLDKYFGWFGAAVFWGKASVFAAQLARRWKRQDAHA